MGILTPDSLPFLKPEEQEEEDELFEIDLQDYNGPIQRADFSIPKKETLLANCLLPASHVSAAVPTTTSLLAHARQAARRRSFPAGQLQRYTRLATVKFIRLHPHLGGIQV